MSVTRRSFVIGIGSILTLSFVRQARAFALDTSEPLLLVPEQPERTIYYELFDGGYESHYRLHLGTPCLEIPEPQRWIDHYRWFGEALDSQPQIDAFCEATEVTEDELYRVMGDAAWADHWAHNLSPEAQAFAFLEEHRIFPRRSPGRREGKVLFQDGPNLLNPSSRWVELHDPVSLALLQARLNELNLATMVREA